MERLRNLAVAVVLASMSGGVVARAENIPPFERALLPITVKNRPGAFGSSWTTSLFYLYRTPLPSFASLVEPLATASACDPPCGVTDLISFSKNSPVNVAYWQTHSGEPPGQLIYLRTEQVKVSLRLSQTGKPGTEIQLPVVRERLFTSGTVDLLGVPVDANYRSTLRIYGIDPTLFGDVRVRAYIDSDSDVALLDETVYSLGANPVVIPQRQIGAGTLDIRPPSVEINFATDRYEGHPKIRYEITPITPGLKIWAFVSVTDKTSQAIVLRTPS